MGYNAFDQITLQ